MYCPFSEGKNQNTLTRHGGNRNKAKVTNYQVKDFSREKYRRLKVCVELMLGSHPSRKKERCYD